MMHHVSQMYTFSNPHALASQPRQLLLETQYMYDDDVRSTFDAAKIRCDK